MEGITRSKGREREVVDATERKVALLEKSFGTEGKSLRLRSTLLLLRFCRSEERLVWRCRSKDMVCLLFEMWFGEL